MSRNGSGTYNLPAGNPVVTGNTISSSWANTTLSDIASALTGSIAADGQTTPTANLVMGTYAHTGVGNATARTMYASAGQVQDSVLTYLTSVAGTNAITASAPIVMTAYATGQTFQFIASASNTGATTININSIGLKSITRDGTTALVAGDLVSGGAYQLIYDGTQFQLTNSSNASVQVTSFSAGTTGLTPSTATTGAITLAGTLGVANGGTGLTTLASSRIPYGNGTGALSSSSTFVFDGTNLGIGTASPVGKLDVVAAAGSSSLIRAYNSTGTFASGWANGSTAGYVGTITNHSLIFATNDTTKMTLDTSGNLGIGTSSPQKKFVVSDSGAGGLEIDPNDAGSGNVRSFAYNRSTSAYINHLTQALNFRFYTGTTPTLNMTLDSSGNVGIGTAVPTSLLHLSTNSATAAGQYNSPSTLTLKNTNGSASVGGTIVFGADSNLTGAGYGASIYYSNISSSPSGTLGDLVFATKSAIATTTVTERMRLDSSGNLLVGKTATDTTNSGVWIYDNNADQGRINLIKTLSGTADAIGNYYSGTYVGGITYSNTATALVTSSDVRLKKDIVDIGSQIDKLLSIKVREFEFIADEGKKVDGFIAQELFEVYPNAVQIGEDNEDGSIKKGWAVNQTALIPLLVKAIQEQQAMIDELKAKVAALEIK